MKLLTSLIVSIAVFIFVSVVGWVEFYPINDSILLGTVTAAGIYWAIALVITVLVGLLGAVVGASAGALLGSLFGDKKTTTAFAGCGAIVVMIGAALAADIYILLNLNTFVDIFPVITLGVAIFISIITTAMGMIFNYEKDKSH